jgi:aldehyde dehydrogenase (NAD+)
LIMSWKFPRALYIDGEWVQPQSAAVEPIINPATEEVIALAPVGGMPELDAGIAAARKAFDSGPWPTLAGRSARPVFRRSTMPCGGAAKTSTS